MATNTLYLVDGTNLYFRAFHVAKPTTARDGTPTGPLKLFCTMINNLRRDYPVTRLMVTFDRGGDGGRRELHPGYKGTRPEHNEINEQIPMAIRAMKAMNIHVVLTEEYEADDLIATYAKIAEGMETGIHTVIVSGDKDLKQLCSPYVTHLNTGNNKWSGPEEVFEDYGVDASQLGDLLALAGDSSDNIPGVAGIGPKTAALLLTKHHSLDAVLAAAKDIPQKGRREKLLAGVESARLSRQLVELQTVPTEGLPGVDELFDEAYDPEVGDAFFVPLGLAGLAVTLETGF